MITTILLGAVIGMLASGTGLGGGFLVVPFLLYLGNEAKVAVGTSFLFVLLISISSLIAHYRLGNVDYKMGLLLSAGGVLGAQFGPIILENIPDEVFKRCFAILMVSIGVWLFVNPKA